MSGALGQGAGKKRPWAEAVTELGRKATTARNQMDSNRRFKQGVVLWLEYADFFYPVSHHSEAVDVFLVSVSLLLCCLALLACDLSVCQSPC